MLNALPSLKASVKKYVVFVLVLVCVVMAFEGHASDESKNMLHSDFDTAMEIALLIRLQYVDPVRVTDLLSAYMETNTIEGMLESLNDQYTQYMDREAYQTYREDVTGTYGGIGIHVGLRNGRPTVIAPMPDTPAMRAGLTSGDVIVAIDGKSTENMSLEEAVSLMKGPESTLVVLTISRGDEPLRDVEIVRAQITIPVVDYLMLEDDIGYLGLITFSADTAQQVQRALDDLISQGAKGLVLDLRWNGGGLFDQAVRVASMFVDHGPIVYRVGRDGIRSAYNRYSDVPIYDLEMIVLVNEWSASSSEILAGALKDSNRAYLVGTRTFGKGLVQGVFPLSNGGALSVTTDRYLTAGGHSIHEVGITPHYVVELPEFPTEQEQDQLSVSTPEDSDQIEELEDPPLADDAADETETGLEDSADFSDGADDSVVAELDGATVQDTQLAKAVEILRSILDGQELPAAS